MFVLLRSVSESVFFPRA